MKKDNRTPLKIKIAEQAKYIKELEDGITSMNNKCVEIRRALESRIEELEAALERIDNWAKSYPLKAFPEPDFDKVAKVLKAAGLSLDAVSASNMRLVITQVKDIVEKALKGGDA